MFALITQKIQDSWRSSELIVDAVISCLWEERMVNEDKEPSVAKKPLPYAPFGFWIHHFYKIFFHFQFNLLKKMLSRNPKKRPTVTCVEQHVTRWRLIEGETVSPWMPNMFDFLHRFFHYSSQLSHFVFLDKTAVNRDKKEKIVSKNRPLKIKKDNHILQ